MKAARLALAILPALLLAPRPGLGAGDGFRALQEQVVEHTLENGLRLILLPRHEVPVFSFATVAEVGSVDEVAGITGIAHMFEHMAFKGSSRIGTTDSAAEAEAMAEVDQLFAELKSARHGAAPPEELARIEEALREAQEKAKSFVVQNEYSAILERNGAVNINATTGFDFTTYFYSLPSNRLELWMSLESERFLDPVLREFYIERDVVKEERFLRIESSPMGRLLEEFVGVAFLAHPYGNLGFGHVSDLDTFTRQEAGAFYRRHYVPSNLIVAVVGDVDPERAVPLAETYFGRLPPGPAPDPVETVEPEQNSERRVTVYGQAQRVALMGYHKPSARHPDEPVYEVLSSILSSGRTSRLYRSLVQEKQIATSAGGFSGFPGEQYPNMFVFFCFPAPGHTNEEVLAAMDEEIEQLRGEPVTEEELDRVKAKAESALVRKLASNLGMAVELARQEALTGDWRDVFRSLERIRAVTAADVLRVARETFRKTNRTIAVLEPEPKADAEPKGGTEE